MQIVSNMLISNTVFATVLAVVVFAVNRICKNHFVAHLLWLLVLVKLLAPPLVGVTPTALGWKQMRSSTEDRQSPLQPGRDIPPAVWQTSLRLSAATAVPGTAASIFDMSSLSPIALMIASVLVVANVAVASSMSKRSDIC